MESFLQVIGNTIGLPKFTVSRIISEVSGATEAKQRQFTVWPTTEVEIQATKEGFFRKGGFPGVIGCVDVQCTTSVFVIMFSITNSLVITA